MISTWSDLPYAILLLGLILLFGFAEQQTALRKQNRLICSLSKIRAEHFLILSKNLLFGFAVWSRNQFGRKLLVCACQPILESRCSSLLAAEEGTQLVVPRKK